ncbi:hypothetical protein HQ571_02475 [Candidatus Kuenenbacteria bacterium]|nr:hypothetical protein [Candidatus Kuenenbacteria bacterium]
MEGSDWMMIFGGFVGGLSRFSLFQKRIRKRNSRMVFFIGLIASVLILIYHWVTGG